MYDFTIETSTRCFNVKPDKCLLKAIETYNFVVNYFIKSLIVSPNNYPCSLCVKSLSPSGNISNI